MAKIVTIASQKGGVGKTTTALNLSFCLSRLGDSVLTIDCDPQGGIAISSNLRKRTDLGLINVLKNEAELKDIIMTTRTGFLSIAGVGAMEAEDVMFFEEEARGGRLGKILRQMAGDFRYVIVDAPAGTGSVVQSLLGGSDSVILLLRPTTLSVKSLPGFLKLIRHVNGSTNPGLALEGVVFTMVNEQDPLELQVYDAVNQAFPEDTCFRIRIPYSGAVEKASRKAVPLGLLEDEDGEANKRYMELAMELKQRELKKAVSETDDERIEELF